MLRDAAIDLLMNRLGQRTQNSLRDQIIGEMVYVQENTLEGNPTPLWFMLTENSDAPTVANDERVKLPADFILEWENGGLYLQNADGTETELIKKDWDMLKAEANSSTTSSLAGTGAPSHYDLAGDYILLRRIPDAIYTIKMRYYGRQTDISGSYGDVNNVENNWLKHASDWFIAEAGVIIATQYLQSPEMAAKFSTQAQEAHDRLIRKNVAFEESNKIRNMDA